MSEPDVPDQALELIPLAAKLHVKAMTVDAELEAFELSEQLLARITAIQSQLLAELRLKGLRPSTPNR